MAEGEHGVTEALSGRRDVLLHCSCRRAQCWHDASASHFTRLALHCLHPCLLLVWKRREGMASDSEELHPSYRERTGASTV